MGSFVEGVHGVSVAEETPLPYNTIRYTKVRSFISILQIYTKDLPYLGGKKNTHNGTGGKYDCIMIFAYYEAPDHTPDMSYMK